MRLTKFEDDTKAYFITHQTFVWNECLNYFMHVNDVSRGIIVTLKTAIKMNSLVRLFARIILEYFHKMRPKCQWCFDDFFPSNKLKIQWQVFEQIVRIVIMKDDVHSNQNSKSDLTDQSVIWSIQFSPWTVQFQFISILFAKIKKQIQFRRNSSIIHINNKFIVWTLHYNQIELILVKITNYRIKWVPGVSDE